MLYEVITFEGFVLMDNWLYTTMENKKLVAMDTETGRVRYSVRAYPMPIWTAPSICPSNVITSYSIHYTKLYDKTFIDFVNFTYRHAFRIIQGSLQLIICITVTAIQQHCQGGAGGKRGKHKIFVLYCRYFCEQLNAKVIAVINYFQALGGQLQALWGKIA